MLGGAGVDDPDEYFGPAPPSLGGSVRTGHRHRRPEGQRHPPAHVALGGESRSPPGHFAPSTLARLSRASRRPRRYGEAIESVRQVERRVEQAGGGQCGQGVAATTGGDSKGAHVERAVTGDESQPSGARQVAVAPGGVIDGADRFRRAAPGAGGSEGVDELDELGVLPRDLAGGGRREVPVRAEA